MDESGHREVRQLGQPVISCLARVEVPAALWGKERSGELSGTDAGLLVTEFIGDYEGGADESPRFVALALEERILRVAAGLCARHGLRAYDGVQLASAVAARAVDPACSGFACFDAELTRAAAREGFDIPI